jgi:hypothetical protein
VGGLRPRHPDELSRDVDDTFQNQVQRRVVSILVS